MFNSAYQTNVIIGANPACPVGQTMIMKAYNGTWYTANNAAITSWSQVTCGAVMSADGTPLLVNNFHTSKNCVDAGGTVVSDGANNMCRFNLASCPATWSWYNSWTSTNAGTTAYCCAGGCYGGCCAGGLNGCISCQVTGHAWSNNPTIEQCYATGGCVNWAGVPTECWASLVRSQIGCY